MDILPEIQTELIKILKVRFENNMHRHEGIKWQKVLEKLEDNIEKLWSLNEMEKTGGEPDLITLDKNTEEYTFYDCSKESPLERRSLCYDQDALNSRKKNKPKNSVIDMADKMGIKLLTEKEYRVLQETGMHDTKTSSWILTPADIRNLGGAIFADFRYGKIFIYHNGAESYYASRGFRGSLKI